LSYAQFKGWEYGPSGPMVNTPRDCSRDRFLKATASPWRRRHE